MIAKIIKKKNHKIYGIIEMKELITKVKTDFIQKLYNYT